MTPEQARTFRRFNRTAKRNAAKIQKAADSLRMYGRMWERALNRQRRLSFTNRWHRLWNIYYWWIDHRNGFN